jgi:sugar phosphate isomerase/epimerase
MKLSFSTLSCPDWSWERIVAEASRLGYDGIELRGIEGEMDLPKAAPFQEGALDASRRQLAALGLEVPALGSGVRFHDPDGYDASLAEGKSYIELACRLGTPYVRIFGDRVPDPAMREETVARIARGIRELSASCEGRPVELLLETHGDFADADLLAEAASVVPLSVSRAEEVTALRAWAAERAVPAD